MKQISTSFPKYLQFQATTIMAPRSQVPQFGNWENGEDVPYTAYFEKAKKSRNPKTNPQIPDPSSNNEPSIRARVQADVRNDELTKSEPETPKDQNLPITNHETRVIREDVDLIKSTGSPTHPKRTSRQSVGADRSFDSSPMHPHHLARVGNRGSGSSEGSRSAASSTPSRSRLRQVTRGDENVDDGSPAIPKFGDWDDNDPASGERYTRLFNKAREDKQSGGGKSPMIITENGDFYGPRHENLKSCSCFPWSRK